MSLLNRIVRLFKADMHGILDAIEEPDVMLKQAVREMQDEIAGSEARLKQLSIHLARLAQQNRELEAALAEHENQIDFCFNANNEAMAKTLLRKKLETRHHLKALGQRRKALAEEQSLLEAELADRRDKLKAILDKMAIFGERHNGTGANPCGGGGDGDEAALKAVSQEDVEIAFLREQQRRLQHQAQREIQPCNR